MSTRSWWLHDNTQGEPGCQCFVPKCSPCDLLLCVLPFSAMLVSLFLPPSFSNRGRKEEGLELVTSPFFYRADHPGLQISLQLRGNLCYLPVTGHFSGSFSWSFRSPWAKMSSLRDIESVSVNSIKFFLKRFPNKVPLSFFLRRLPCWSATPGNPPFSSEAYFLFLILSGNGLTHQALFPVPPSLFSWLFPSSGGPAISPFPSCPFCSSDRSEPPLTTQLRSCLEYSNDPPPRSTPPKFKAIQFWALLPQRLLFLSLPSFSGTPLDLLVARLAT